MKIWSIIDLSLSLLFCIPTCLMAQVPTTYGMITPEELNLKYCPFDTAAEAVVLNEITRYDIDRRIMKYTLTKHVRIKILKASAINKGDIAIYFLGKNNVETIDYIGAHTIMPDGSVRSVLKEQFLDEKLHNGYLARKFSFRSVQEGCILEYYYVKTSSRLFVLPDFYFQGDIPVLSSEMILKEGVGMKYTCLIKGIDQFDKHEGNIYSKDDMVLQVDWKRFTGKNIRAMKETTHITTMDDFRIGVQFQLSEFYQGDGHFQTWDSWGKLAENMLKFEHFGQQFKKPSNSRSLRDDAKLTIEAEKTDSAKIVAAFNWVSANVSWSGEFSGFADEELDKLYKQKNASSGALNIMMLAILEPYHIEGLWPAMVSTRSNGRIVKLHPFEYQFNHMMLYYEGGSTPRWYDVHDEFQETGKPCYNALNGTAWIVDKDALEPRFIDIIPTRGSDAVMFRLTVSESESSLTGTASGSYTGYNAHPERVANKTDSIGLHWVERLKERYPDVVIDSVTRQNLYSPSLPFKENFKIILPNAVTVNNDMLYLAPVVYSGFLESPFKEPTRALPIMYAYPIRETIVMTIVLPDGYEVAEAPENMNLTLSTGTDLTFSYTARLNDENTLLLTSKVEINRLQYEPDEYQSVKELFDRIAEKLGEQLVLKKKA